MSPSWVVANANIHCGAFLTMVARIAIRDGNDRRLRLCLLFPRSRLRVLPAHGKRRGVHMHLLHLHAKDLARLSSNASKQLGGVMRVQPIERAPQAVDTLASLP